MTGRERILTAMAHSEPDRVPTGENQVYGKLASHIVGYETLYSTGWEEQKALWEGRRDDVVRDYGRTIIDIAHKLEWDYVRVPAVPPEKDYPTPEMTGPYSWIDSDGRGRRLNPDVGNILQIDFDTSMSIDDLPAEDTFFFEPSQLDALRYVVETIKKTHFIIGKTPLDGSFPWELTVGLEEFLIRMITDEEFVARATQIHVNRSVTVINAFLEAGADAIMTTDDYCDNRGPIMGVELFRKFIKPAIAKQADAIHAKGGLFVKHTDGNVWEILDDLVECGIDAWHGIQPGIGMDLASLKKRYGKRLCLFGGTNCDTMIEGNPDQVVEEVKTAISGAAHGGGLVVTTSNVVQPGVKYHNYLAMRKAIRDYGRYPIGI